MQTTCKNCGTPQGPFVRDRDFPNTPVCGFPPRYRFDNRDAREKAVRKTTQECLARRDARYKDVD